MPSNPRVVAIMRDGPLHRKRVSIAPGQRVYLAARPGRPGSWYAYLLYAMADGRVFGLAEGLIIKAISSMWTQTEMAHAAEGVLWKATQETHRRVMVEDGGLWLYYCVTSQEDQDMETAHTYYTVRGVLP